jgi:predicted O-methyltransferase YrrM
MYSAVQLAIKYFEYYLSASNSKGHGMHSPFVFGFIVNVLNDRRKYPAYHQVEEMRNRLSTDSTVITVEDFGAGSSVDKTNNRTIASIAKNAAKSAKYGKLLHRMVKYYQPHTILELGTSLGITTAYLSLGKPDGRVVTMEGAAAIAATARNNFDLLQIQNVSIEEGNFDLTLSPVLSRLPVIDFAFIDGNHRREPTEKYFNQLLNATHNDSIFIFDDIHWSKDMEKAWETIKQHPSVRCTIDLFFIGIVSFRQEFKEKQHFSIRF